METAILAVLIFALAFSALSRPLSTGWLSGPMVFTLFGIAAGSLGAGVLIVDPGAEMIHVLAELTLVLILFADASQINLRRLWKDIALPARLLGIGMPLTIAAGLGLGLLLFPELTFWEAAMLAAILTPTDAALGQAVVSSELVPESVREALTVEGGLNDGVALPIILAFLGLAVAMDGEAPSASHWVGFWIQQVTLGPLVGVVVGGLGGALFTVTTARGWVVPSFEKVGGLCIALLCFFVAEAVGGNGLISAFIGGLTLGNVAPMVREHVESFLEVEGQVLMLMVFVLLGCALVAPSLEHLTVRVVIYSLLSLTAIRMVPVALALLGSGLGAGGALFVGWFGPRGLASLLFAMLLMDEHTPNGEFVFNVVILTVLLSVFLHGLTAQWGVKKYSRYRS